MVNILANMRVCALSLSRAQDAGEAHVCFEAESLMVKAEDGPGTGYLMRMQHGTCKPKEYVVYWFSCYSRTGKQAVTL